MILDLESIKILIELVDFVPYIMEFIVHFIGKKIFLIK